MAINDISLTAGMRTNLISLQGTIDLLNRTQERLATGKKVNTPLDNPLNFFTAQALTSRASDLTGLKDAMGEAVQTVKSANNGISAISGLIEQAKAIAASAKAAETGGATAYVTEQISLTGVTSGTYITIGSITFTATSCTVTTSSTFNIGGNDAADAAGFAAALTAHTGSNAVCNITVGGIGGNVITLTAVASAVNISTTSVIAGTGVVTTMLAANAADRANYAAQYNSIRTQIDNIANDSNYKGTNLLDSNTLDVSFGTSATDKMSIEGFDGTSSGLGLTAANLDWAVNANIDVDLALLVTSTNTLKAEASNLSSGLSIVNTRQDWVKSMVNTLTQGADNLTLADMNEEGANMLMLQTRQALGTTALSLSAQAAQSVLKLF